MNPRRIHITGGPGAGKTTLAIRLSRELGVSYHELDGMALGLVAEMPAPLDLPALMARRLPLCQDLAGADAWISEGSNLDASLPFYERAELIVYLTCSWRVAAYRIVLRHIKAELARNNRFPGWRNLYRFWRWSGRYYANRNQHASNAWGTPETEAYCLERLREWQQKLVVCRSKAELGTLVSRVVPR
jgi:hypothetical protein